jgi:hypothetical protein
MVSKAWLRRPSAQTILGILVVYLKSSKREGGRGRMEENRFHSLPPCPVLLSCLHSLEFSIVPLSCLHCYWHRAMPRLVLLHHA